MSSFLILGVKQVLVSDPDSPYYDQTLEIAYVQGHTIFAFVGEEVVEFEEYQLIPIL